MIDWAKQVRNYILNNISEFVDPETNEISLTKLEESVCNDLNFWERDSGTGEYFCPQWVSDIVYTQSINYEQMLNGLPKIYDVMGVERNT